jgi:hypothetical protein
VHLANKPGVHGTTRRLHDGLGAQRVFRWASPENRQAHGAPSTADENRGSQRGATKNNSVFSVVGLDEVVSVIVVRLVAGRQQRRQNQLYDFRNDKCADCGMRVIFGVERGMDWAMEKGDCRRICLG